MDDLRFRFEEPRTLEVAFTLYQFQGERRAVVTEVEVGGLLYRAEDRMRESPLAVSTDLALPEPLARGDARPFAATLEFPEAAADPDAFRLWSAAILVRYRIESGGIGGEVAYGSPCYSRVNEKVNTSAALCSETYTYTGGRTAPPPGAPVWDERLDACCRPAANAS